MNIQFLFARMGLRAFGPRTLGSKAVSFFCCMLPDVLQAVALMMYRISGWILDLSWPPRPQSRDASVSLLCVFPAGSEKPSCTGPSALEFAVTALIRMGV